MGMGVGSNKKRSIAGIVVCCVVLGLALLVAEAAGHDTAYCDTLCRGRPYFQYIGCVDRCMLTPGQGAAARLAGHRRTAGEEARVGGVGGRAGLLAMPAERAGREEEVKTKQADAVVRLADPYWCYDLCRDQKEKPEDQCVDECYAENMPDAARLAAHGGAGGEEARGGGADALTAMADGRQKYGRCRGFVDCSVKPCVWRCMRQAGEESATHQEIEETRGEAVSVLAAVGKHKCDWFRDCSVTPCVWHCGKRRVQEEDDEETRTGALNVLAAARHEVAVGACSGTVYVEACYACCQREVTKNPDFDWYACIRSCHDAVALPIKKERENKDGVVPPAK